MNSNHSASPTRVLVVDDHGIARDGIAHILSLSPMTVDTYRSRLMQKLGVRNRASLIRFALAHAFAPN
jgi:DNA-binding NarL/FixJ family response regulator